MLEVLRIVRTGMALFGNLGLPVLVVMIEPLVTVAILLLLYAGWHVGNEGSIEAGLRAAFLESRASRAEHQAASDAALLQGELHRAAAADKLIDQLLTALLQRAPLAARVRLGVVHNGIAGLTGAALLRVDVTHGVADAGHTPGPMSVNQPLSEWNGFLPTLLAGRCDFHRTEDEMNVGIRARLLAMGAGSFMACPVIDLQGRMLGGVSVTWDERVAPPAGEDMRSLMEFARSICIQIAAALSLGGRLG